MSTRICPTWIIEEFRFICGYGGNKKIGERERERGLQNFPQPKIPDLKVFIFYFLFFKNEYKLLKTEN